MKVHELIEYLKTYRSEDEVCFLGFPCGRRTSYSATLCWRGDEIDEEDDEADQNRTAIVFLEEDR